MRHEDLDALRVSGAPTMLSVRPPGELPHRLSDVVVVEFSDSTVTIELPSGERRKVDVGTIVDMEGERSRRRRWRRVGLIIDSLGLTR